MSIVFVVIDDYTGHGRMQLHGKLRFVCYNTKTDFVIIYAYAHAFLYTRRE